MQRGPLYAGCTQTRDIAGNAGKMDRKKVRRWEGEDGGTKGRGGGVEGPELREASVHADCTPADCECVPLFRIVYAVDERALSRW